MDVFKITLEAARRNKGLTQKEVAEKVGVSKVSVCAWESGRARLTADMLFHLCELYEVPVQNIELQKKE